ncbi:MAG TPA: response regulator [candidate division Zixibacteria bacterium]|nr:response regulator [candidate division Zixibacteria bacterium]
MSAHIIIIDDDRNIRLLYEHELSCEGYQVATASSAAEAIEKASAEPFNLAILDIEMPDMSGLELLGKLRELRPNMPVILNSAYSTYKSDFKSWLADAYVVKSSDIEPLKQTVKEMLSNYGS